MYLMRLDDASEHMDTDKWTRMEKLLDKYGIKPIFGIIPHNEDPQLITYENNPTFWNWARQKIAGGGWVPAMHGYARAKKRMHAKRVEYVPGVGIDLQKFASNRLTQEKKESLQESVGVVKGDRLLFSVGELNANKNHEAVIRALANIEDKSVHYAIAGAGDLHDYLMNLANELGISERIHLLGYCDDVADFYGVADLYIHPSLREGLSVALMEAIASKTAVICSDIRGNTDLVGKSALFEPKNVNQIADKICEYLNRDNSEEIEKNYDELKKFGLEEVSNDIKAIYSELKSESCGSI